LSIRQIIGICLIGNYRSATNTDPYYGPNAELLGALVRKATISFVM